MIAHPLRALGRSLPLGLLLAAALLLPRNGSAATLEVPGGPVVLGQAESVPLDIRIDEAPGIAEDRPLRLAANVGGFGDISRLGPGRYRAVYLPPKTRFPQVCLIAVWRETGPDAPIEFLRLPLLGKTRLEIGAARGTELTVGVGDQLFGPVVPDRNQKALVPVIVPPGVAQAVVTARSKDGQTTERSVPVTVPPYNRLTAALVPHAIAADGKSWARLEVLYDAASDDALAASAVRVDASLGEVSLLRVEAGRFVYRYLPPAGVKQEEVRFTVGVRDDPVAQAQARLGLRLAPPSRIVLRPPPEPIPADGTSKAYLSLLVLDEEGLGLPGQRLEVTSDGAPLAPVEDQGDGVYRVAFVAPRHPPPGGLVHFEARAAGKAGQVVRAGANYQLEPLPTPAAVVAELSPRPVPADGQTVALLTFELRDRTGRRLPGPQIYAFASHGTLSDLRELADGRYEARYVPPTQLPAEEAFVRIVDSAGLFEHTLPLPLRESSGRVLLGVRGGLFHNLGKRYGPRAGLDAWVPLRLGVPLGLGLSATYGQYSQTVGEASALSSESTARFLPVTLRAGAELLALRRLSLTAGAGAILTFAQLTTSLTEARASALGFGGMGFGSVGYAIGPGQAFLDVSYNYSQVKTQDFRLDAGGVGVEVGYRFGVF